MELEVDNAVSLRDKKMFRHFEWIPMTYGE